MANLKQVVRQKVTETVDHTTGEVYQKTTENVSYLPTEPPFVKVYLDDIAKLYGLPKAGSSLLHALLRKMDYEGIITLVSSSKQRIANELGIKSQTIDNNIQALLKANILKRAGRGEFMFNPALFAKGEWKNIYKQRNKYIELTVIYSNDGERIVSGKVKAEQQESPLTNTNN
jgi:predicted transcriptional regulator